MAFINGGEQIVIDSDTGIVIEQRGVPQLNNARNGGGRLSHSKMFRQVYRNYILARAQIVIANTSATLSATWNKARAEEDFDVSRRRGWPARFARPSTQVRRWSPVLSAKGKGKSIGRRFLIS